MKTRLTFAWYDLWVGAYWDGAGRRLFLFPLPCCGVVFEFDQLPPPWPAGVPEVTIEEAHISRERGIEMRLKHPLFAKLAEDMCGFFHEYGGRNYVELVCATAESGPMILTVRRMDGETPGARAARLEKRVAELEAAAAKTPKEQP